MRNRIILCVLLFPYALIQGRERSNYVTLPADNFAYSERAENPLAGEPLFTDDLLLRVRLNRLHKIAGYSTLALGFLTGLTAGEADDGGLHQALGISTAALSGATMGLGYAAHRGEVRTGAMSTVDKIHTLLGISGGAMMLAAPFFAPSDAHKILGEAGLAAMGIAVGWEIIY